MKKIMLVTMALVMSFMMVFAFTACGSSEPTPEDQAVQSLDKILSALKSADMESIKALAGDEGDVSDSVEETFGSDEDTQAVLKCMLGHFDYTIGTPEVVDESNINIPVTVSNADMSQAVTTWFTDVMTYAMSNPDASNDQDALQAKALELLQTAVDKTAEAEDGIVTEDVVFPMMLENGEWKVNGEQIDDGVLDAITGGFMTAINNVAGGLQ